MIHEAMKFVAIVSQDEAASINTVIEALEDYAQEEEALSRDLRARNRSGRADSVVLQSELLIADALTQADKLRGRGA